MLQIYAPITDLSTLSSFSFRITARESPSISTLKNPSCKPISAAWKQAIASAAKGECMLTCMIVFDQRTRPESSLIIILEQDLLFCLQNLASKFIFTKCSFGIFQHTRVECCPSCNSLLRAVHIAHIAQQNTRQRQS
uniref:Uncharacterized protein n=1 Tax=Gossypium raimondii TaxID=29730 RepID=A0A0D2QGS0_GOSRA|nr:hypothetical protein B456_003G069900 [Gossypium raimondii]KJB18809.1 hypothetical protein B456_003G069900 [Gossypium raimondii]